MIFDLVGGIFVLCNVELKRKGEELYEKLSIKEVILWKRKLSVRLLLYSEEQTD